MRFCNVLSARVAANIRQLEVKISESGPADKRPQPHILNVALRSERVEVGGPMRRRSGAEVQWRSSSVSGCRPSARKIGV
jgi:hypothetical protein